MHKTTDETHDVMDEHVALWPPILALSVALIGFAVILLYSGNVIVAFALVGIFLLLVTVFIYHELLGKKEVHIKKLSESLNLPRYMWMWVFLASEVLFFGLIIGISLGLRIRALYWYQLRDFLINVCGLQLSDVNIVSIPDWNAVAEVLRSQLLLTTLITFFLLLSSVTMMKAVEAAQKDDTTGVRNYLLATFLFGVIFLLVKFFEYFELYQEGFTLETNVLWTTFYLQTGFHAAHVFTGVLIMIFFILKAFQGTIGKKNADSIELLGIYWHFVDIVWILLFPLLYLIG